MLTVEQHFSAGYLPAAVGAYFNVALLLATVSTGASPALSAAITEQIPLLRQSGERLKENVRHVQALAELAGFVPPPPPRVPEEYFDWFTKVHGSFRAGVVVHETEEVVWAFGHRVGEVLCGQVVAITTLRLLAAEPRSAVLLQQRGACAADLLLSVRALLVTTQHPRLPQALYALGELLHASVSGSAEQLEAGTLTAEDLEEQLREMRVAAQHAAQALNHGGAEA